MSTTDLATSLLSDASGVLAWVARASVLGGCGILLTCLVRRVCGKRLSPALRLALWTPAMLLLLMPRLPDLGLGLVPVVPAVIPQMPVGAPDEDVPSQVSEVQFPALEVTEPGPTMQAGWSLTWREEMALVWCTVIFLMLAWWIITHLLWWRRVLRQSGPVSSSIAERFVECCADVGLRKVPRLVASRAVENPAVSGILRATVIIPEDLETTLSSAELRHVLLHEAAHVRRHDLRWNWAALAVLVLHWFNPLVWLAVRLMRSDREAACDATVLSTMSGDARMAYGTTLLRIQERLAHLGAPHSRLGTLGSADMLRERILDIVHHGRRSTRTGAAALVISVACAGIVALLGAEPPKAEAPVAPVPLSPSENERAASNKNSSFRADLFCGTSDPSKQNAFIESQIEVLKGQLLRQKAEARVKALHPDMVAVPVTLDVTRPFDTRIYITVAASEPSYARSFLDALLDEMMAYRKTVEAAAYAAAKANPDTKELMEDVQVRLEQLADLVEVQRAAEATKAPSDIQYKLTETLIQQRRVYGELERKLKAAMPGDHVVIFQRPAAEPRKIAATPLPDSTTEKELERAYSYYNRGDYDKATQTFQDVLRTDPQNGAARRGMERAESKRAETFDIARDWRREKLLFDLGQDWGGGPTAGAYYAEKMQKIIFPQVQFKGASVEEAVEFLRIKSRDYDVVEPDPTKRGVNLIIRPGAPLSTKTITLDLKNVSMIEALRQITELGGMKFRIERYAVVVVPLVDTGAELYTRTLKVPPDFLTAAVGGKAPAAPFAPAPGIAGRPTALEVLKAHGFSFPEGASASFVPATSQLIVRNTPENLDKIDAFVEELWEKPSNTKAAEAGGLLVSRARIEFVAQKGTYEGKSLEEFVETQIETLGSPALRKRAEERAKTLQPGITPVPVIITAVRVKETAQIEIFAKGASGPYVQLLLDSLLDEMVVYRKEAFKNSLPGTAEKVIEEVLIREKRVQKLDEEYKTAATRNASEEKMAQLKAQLEREVQDHRTWVKKLESLGPSLSALPQVPKMSILERPAQVKADGK